MLHKHLKTTILCLFWLICVICVQKLQLQAIQPVLHQVTSFRLWSCGALLACKGANEKACSKLLGAMASATSVPKWFCPANALPTHIPIHGPSRPTYLPPACLLAFQLQNIIHADCANPCQMKSCHLLGLCSSASACLTAASFSASTSCNSLTPWTLPAWPSKEKCSVAGCDTVQHGTVASKNKSILMRLTPHTLRRALKPYPGTPSVHLHWDFSLDLQSFHIIKSLPWVCGAITLAD